MIPGIELLRFNHAGAMVLKTGQTVNYGVIRIEEDKLIYYTGKGLREIWKPDLSGEEKVKSEELQRIANSDGGEEQLIASEHIATTPLNQIERVIF